jgi:enterochelin esterase-like enzyme
MFKLANIITVVLLTVPFQVQAQSTDQQSQLVTISVESDVLKSNILGVDPNRSTLVYLPPGYAQSDKHYPVIYFLHSFIFDNPNKLFDEWSIQALLDKQISQARIKPFIFVMADYSTEFVGSFYQNDPHSGRWLDFTADELVDAIDSQFRTLADNAHRGISGHFMGGRGALALAMTRPDVFSSVYALHPVATDSGMFPMATRPNWDKILSAKDTEELAGDGFAMVFSAMSQAFLPNPDNPPFYTDFMVERMGDKIVLNPSRADRLYKGFLLDNWVPKYVDNLRGLRGIKFDWGRYDSNIDHIYANQAFTRLLNEYGIEHEAEEYDGDTYSKNWIENGRVETDMLPFFARTLSFR